ncbi:MAG: 7-carboxy-7-deazaguanine synthase QueE [Candidatus Omnitrophica bacterium]|nr:7-carboxy-7-deazaguanine synthase QueE [Candidatus Omnitrophota bacterium]MDD5653895.1 7-carboxy-7-deazaguanine synthase QueE [Candidatus Omnitrophota bacterium]
MKGKIAEIFDSIQGEGIYLGEKQLFVRFFGCKLVCKFCDTKLNYFREYTPDELFKELKSYKDSFHSLAFTGGEPLEQKDFLKEVLRLAKSRGFKTYLETNGVLPDELEEVIDLVDIVAMDLKLPSSTGQKAFWQEHSKFLEIAGKKEVFLKAVICLSTTEEDMKEVVKLIKAYNKSVVLVLQPNSFESSKELEAKCQNFKDMLMREQVTVCLIPQMHKIMGVR